jgi:hypothetical protein
MSQSARPPLPVLAEPNLPLLAHPTAFHGPDLDAAGLAVDYFAPWLRIVKQGQADGSLAPREYGWNPRRPATP